MKKSFAPKYYRIREENCRHIALGQYTAFQRIPSQSELAWEFNVNLRTVERAIRLLVAEGVLYKEQGKGTFAVFFPLDEIPFKLSDFWEEARKAVCKIGVKPLKAEIRPIDELRSSRPEPSNGASIIESIGFATWIKPPFGGI